jgi:iron complex outermembrane recepter protein
MTKSSGAILDGKRQPTGQGAGMRPWSCSGALLRTLTFSLLVGMPLPAAWAAAAPDETPAASEGISEVVVTATHREENAKDVPVSISVVDSNLITSLGNAGDDIKQLAFRVPSLNIESSNGRAFPRLYIRGYGNTDFHDFASQPVGLYYDDIVQENPALKGFPIFDQADVEVLRGPQGTLFGRNSPAGVVKLESAKPQLGVTSGYFSISDGTFNTAVVEGVVNVPINDAMAFRASTQIQHRDNWVNDPINQTRNGGYNDWGARVQLLFKPTDSFSVLLNVHGRSLDGSSTLFRGNIIELGGNRLVPGFSPGTLYTDGPNNSTLGTIGANVHVSWTLPAVTLQSITGYETVQKYLAEGDIDGGYGPGNVFCNLATCAGVPASGPGYIPFAVETSAGLLHHEQLTQEFRVLTNYSGPLQAQGGVFLFYENVEAADNDYCTPGSTTNNCPNEQLWGFQDTTVSRQRNDAEAIFGSLDYKPIETFKATAGVRLTEDHKEFVTLYSNTVPPPTAPLAASAGATNVSWDLSGTYSVTPDINVYARVATGFRAPSFGPPAAGLPVQVAGSEKIISYEAGVKAELWDHKARISWDAYFFDVKDQQLTAVGGSANVIQLINAQKTLGKGSELEIELHPIANLTFNLSGSYNETRIEDPTLGVAPCFDWSFIPGLANVKCHVSNDFDAAGHALINGNPLPQAPRWVGDLGLRYDHPLPDGSSVYAYTDLSTRGSMNIFLYRAEEFTAQPLTQVGLRLGYTWSNDKYDVAAFCRNCANQIRVIGGIDFADALGFINDPRIFGAQFRAKF